MAAEPPRVAPLDDLKSLDVIYQVTTDELKAQQAVWDDADRRLQLLIGFVGVVFGAALGVSGAQSASPAVARWAAAAAMVCLSFTALVAVAAYLPRRMERPANVGHLRDAYLTADPQQTKRTLIDTTIDALEHNDDLIREKLDVFRLGLVSFMVSAFLLAFAIVLRLVAGG